MKIFISLPVSGRDLQEAREHADRVKAHLSRSGHQPVNPLEIYHGRHPTYDEIICEDLRALAACDAIYLCDGWENSRGCRIQRSFAEEFAKDLRFETPPAPAILYYNQ